MGNVAVFDTESRIPGDKICFALNQRLPDDVQIQASGGGAPYLPSTQGKLRENL